MSHPSHRILEIVPGEDVGALTLARYGYQHNCAVPYALQTLAEKRPVIAVVCETHEDLLVLHHDGAELVSVKHRELSRGPWTLTELCNGPVSHLLDRWLRTNRLARCKLLTNHGLRPGSEQAEGLADACKTRDATALSRWAGVLAPALAIKAEDLVEFLRVFSIQSGLPSRDHIADIYRTHQLRPLLRRLGLSPDADDVIYGRILAEIARASSDQSTAGPALLAAMLASGRDTKLAELRRRIAQRTIDRERVSGCLTDLPSAKYRLAAATDPPAATRMVQKLQAGHLGETAIRSAQRLRAEWYDLESRWRGLPGTASDFDDLRARAQALAALVESQISQQDPYAKAMHLMMAERLAQGALQAASPISLDPDLLLGLMYQLTDECHVWWSEPFALT